MWSPTAPDDPDEFSSKRLTWPQQIRASLTGIKAGIRGQSSFFLHIFFAALSIVAAVALGCNVEQWCILLLCIGSVMIVELIRSAFESLFNGLDPEAREGSRRSLDIASGAALVASLTALAVGSLVFASRLWQMFDVSGTSSSP